MKTRRRRRRRMKKMALVAMMEIRVGSGQLTTARLGNRRKRMNMSRRRMILRIRGRDLAIPMLKMKQRRRTR